jgi:hypothetical protein
VLLDNWRNRRFACGYRYVGRNAEMRIICKALGCLCIFVTAVFAEDRTAPTAASRPVYEVSAGYTCLNLAMPSASRVTIDGGDANIVVHFTSRLGATVDSSYARSGSVFNTGHGGSVLNFLAGPVFYSVGRRRVQMFVHGLAGVSRVDSATPISATSYIGGSVTRFSYAVGGGVEYDISRVFGVRGGADYLRTTFIDKTAAMQHQYNLRIVVGLVYRLSNR